MKRTIGLEKVLYEQNEKYGSMWEGDFNSDASKQSCFDFWKTFFTLGPTIAVSK